MNIFISSSARETEESPSHWLVLGRGEHGTSVCEHSGLRDYAYSRCIRGNLQRCGGIFEATNLLTGAICLHILLPLHSTEVIFAKNATFGVCNEEKECTHIYACLENILSNYLDHFYLTGNEPGCVRLSDCWARPTEGYHGLRGVLHEKRKSVHPRR